jgi:hypothetical protein
MRPLPKRRLGLVALTVAVAAVVASWLWVERPWEARFLNRPTSYWADQVARQPASHLAPPLPSPTGQWFERIFARVGLGQAPGPGVIDLLGPPEATPVLVELLRDNNPHVRGMAAHLLSLCSPRPKEAVPALLQAWQRCKDQYRTDFESGRVFLNEADAANAILSAIWHIDPEAARQAGVPRVEPGPQGDNLD